MGRGGGEPPRAEPLRLLVLGAGPAQLGLLEAARAHGIWTAVCDRDPGARRASALADRRCIVSTEDEPTIERLAAALAARRRDRAGLRRGRSASRRASPSGSGSPHPISPATAVARHQQAPPARGARRRRRPQPRWEVVARRARRARGRRASSRRPSGTAAPAARSCSTTPTCPAAIEAARARLAERRRARRGARRRARGGGQRVLGRRRARSRSPSTDRDRRADGRPAFGVALAHVWPSPHAEAAVEVTRRAVEALGIEDGPDVHAPAAQPRRARGARGRRRGSAAATTPSSSRRRPAST